MSEHSFILNHYYLLCNILKNHLNDYAKKTVILMKNIVKFNRPVEQNSGNLHQICEC